MSLPTVVPPLLSNCRLVALCPCSPASILLTVSFNPARPAHPSSPSTPCFNPLSSRTWCNQPSVRTRHAHRNVGVAAAAAAQAGVGGPPCSMPLRYGNSCTGRTWGRQAEQRKYQLRENACMHAPGTARRPVPDPRAAAPTPIGHPLRLSRASKGAEKAVSGGSGRFAGRSCSAPLAGFPALSRPAARIHDLPCPLGAAAGHASVPSSR